MAATSLRACVFVLFMAALAPAHAGAPASVFLEDLTSPELAARIRAGATVAIVPIGGTEQNGAHMALGKHNVRVRLLAERVARKLGNTIVAPVVAYTPESRGHLRHPGTLDVPADVYRGVLLAAGRSLKLAGFHDVVFLGDSGDYQRDNEVVARRLNEEWSATRVRAHAILDYYRAATADFAQALRKQGFRDEEIGPHAGLADTSLMLALDPALVRRDRMQRSEGVTGDPTRASADLGRNAVDTIVDKTAAAIRAAVARP
jgi:creatinine amidohydrolase/Fe(II)-dependent formamide hydrolase-like protein